jgi:hypothetical protein
MILSQKESDTILEFVAKNGGDDIVIAAGLRTMYNINEAEELRSFVATYKPKLHAGDFVGTKRSESPEISVRQDAVIDSFQEDLGEVPKKLGKNGQAILKLMAKHPAGDWSVDGLSTQLKLSKAIIKSQLALLIERGKVVRASNTTYRWFE